MVALEYVNICDIYRDVMVWWLLHHSILDGIGTLALPFLKDSYKSRQEFSGEDKRWAGCLERAPRLFPDLGCAYQYSAAEY